MKQEKDNSTETYKISDKKISPHYLTKNHARRKQTRYYLALHKPLKWGKLLEEKSIIKMIILYL